MSTSSAAQGTVRRIIVYTLLFVLVIVAASGLSGLLGQLLDTRFVLAREGATGLAQSLAFTLVGGPLAIVLWWFLWRRLSESAERRSLAWGLYIAAVYSIALITFTTALLRAAAALVDSEWLANDFSTGVVWLGVWLWHRWMWRHSARSPIRLATVPLVIGWVFGLALAIGAAVAALAALLDAAIRGVTDVAAIGDPWWMPALQSLSWAVGGALIWWWHWFRGSAHDVRTGFSNVALVVAGVLAASLLALGGLGTTLFVLLRLLFDRSEPMGELLSPLGTAIAAALVGALVWTYHRGVVRRRSEATRHASRLVTAAVGLVAAASGIGVIVNATLAALAPAVTGTDSRTLLLGGISSLIVGAPVWWFVWRPGGTVESKSAAFTGRRIYLVAVFGVSAVVALITLLVIGFRLFEFLLEDATGASLIERVRAPLGLLIATGLVAGYHFSVWRRDRGTVAAATPAQHPTISQVVLVTGSDAEAQSQLLRESTGASVTTWVRTDTDAAPGADDLAAALETVTAQRVLVITGAGGQLQVIPLAD